MERFIEPFSSKRIAWTSCLAVFISIVLVFLESKQSCSYVFNYSISWCAYIVMYLSIFFPILFFALVSSRLKNNNSWVSFTGWYLFIFLIIYVFTPNESRSFISFDKELLIIFIVPLYSVISVVYLLMNKKN
jgi:hypothetical protein